MKYLNNDDKYDLSGTQYGQALTYIKKYSWLIISDWNINGPILGSGLHIQNKRTYKQGNKNVAYAMLCNRKYTQQYRPKTTLHIWQTGSDSNVTTAILF